MLTRQASGDDNDVREQLDRAYRVLVAAQRIGRQLRLRPDDVAAIADRCAEGRTVTAETGAAIARTLDLDAGTTAGGAR